MANILAVDDEKAILNMIESILVKDSHTVTKIDEPTKIEMDKLSHFDLILLDVMMPGIDGFELCSKIRNVVDCPILFITAKTDEGSLVNGLAIGVDVEHLQPTSRILNGDDALAMEDQRVLAAVEHTPQAR